MTGKGRKTTETNLPQSADEEPLPELDRPKPIAASVAARPGTSNSTANFQPEFDFNAIIPNPIAADKSPAIPLNIYEFSASGSSNDFFLDDDASRTWHPRHV